jgi:hypothetical protein
MQSVAWEMDIDSDVQFEKLWEEGLTMLSKKINEEKDLEPSAKAD